MDYGFVPGLASGDRFLTTINAALQLHPNLTLLSPSPDTISDFLLNAKIMNIAVPSEDLILGTHADDEGVILVAIDSNTSSPVTYEKLQSASTITLPPELNKPPTSFRIFGCIIGSDRCIPVLQLLKQKLGNPHAVVAPKYLYGVAPFGGGFLETMLYDFRIMSPAPLASRDAVKQAFQAGSNATPPQFVDVNGTKISPDLWETWLPKSASLRLDPPKQDVLPLTIKAAVPVTSTLNVVMDFPGFWVATHETITIPHVDLGGPFPSNKSAKELALASIPNDPRFHSHPYPWHTRYYYDSPQTFINNVHWIMAASEGGNLCQFTFDRYRYELFIPLTEPPSDNLICNYYKAGLAPIVGMFSGNSVDARLFAVV